MTTEITEPSIGDRMREAFGGIDMHAAVRLTFGKCPKCGVKLVRGSWLRFCPDRACQKYVGVLNKELGKTIEHVAPQSDEEQAQLKRLATTFGVAMS